MDKSTLYFFLFIAFCGKGKNVLALVGLNGLANPLDIYLNSLNNLLASLVLWQLVLFWALRFIPGLKKSIIGIFHFELLSSSAESGYVPGWWHRTRHSTFLVTWWISFMDILHVDERVCQTPTDTNKTQAIFNAAHGWCLRVLCKPRLVV